MNDTITYQRLTSAEARAAITILKPIYTNVFSLPPYNEGPEMAEKFADWITAESKHSGFTMIVASRDGEPVGFAYGYTMPTGEWFRNTGQPAPAQVKAAEKFAVMEWAVLPEHRGAGIGRTLMELLLDGRPEPWAVLTVNPAAGARAIYERTGWKHVASTKTSRDWPAMFIMVLDRQSEVITGSGGPVE